MCCQSCTSHVRHPQYIPEKQPAREGPVTTILASPKTRKIPRHRRTYDAGHHMVGVAGFEPTASSSRTKRATKLRHTPCFGNSIIIALRDGKS